METTTAIITGILGLITIIGYAVAVAKNHGALKQRVCTVEKDIRDLSESKDKDIFELKQALKEHAEELKDFKEAYQKGNANLVTLINDKHVDLMKQIKEDLKEGIKEAIKAGKE